MNDRIILGDEHKYLPAQELTWCFEHQEAGIKKRYYGELRCAGWQGPDDDPCYIRLALVIEKYPDES